jgi:hypothetical protein
VAIGKRRHPLVGVDVQDLLGRGIQGIDRPIRPGLRGLPGVQGGLDAGRLQDVLDFLVFAGVEPVQHLGHAKALDGGGVEHGGQELDPQGLPEAVLGSLLLGGGLLDRVGQLDRGLLRPRPGPTRGQRGPLRALQPGGAERVQDQDLALAGASRQGGAQHVGFDRGRDQRPGPFQDPGDHRRRGLETAGGAEDQHRVAVLGGQQPPAQPRQARGAAQDHPARRGPANGEQAQLTPLGPHRAATLVLPAGTVPRRPARQIPNHRGRTTGRAGDHRGCRGVHADRAGQLAVSPCRPGQRRVAQVVGQAPQQRGHVGDAQVQPGVAEHQAGELPSGPDQQPGRARAKQPVEHELLAEAAERRAVRRAIPAGRVGRPRLTPHPDHLPPYARHGRGGGWRAGGCGTRRSGR